MYRRKGEEICGVLNDFDLATPKGDSSPSSKQRTGTKPYMAIQLLDDEGIAHGYRHDLESLFYVILIVTSHFSDGEEIADPPLQTWLTVDSKTLATYKSHLITHFKLPTPTASYTGFTKWLEPMSDAFSDGIHWKNRNRHMPNLDLETLGDHVTFAKFSNIFDMDVTSGQVATM